MVLLGICVGLDCGVAVNVGKVGTLVDVLVAVAVDVSVCIGVSLDATVAVAIVVGEGVLDPVEVLDGTVVGVGV